MKKTQFDQVEKGWVVRQAVYNQKPKGYQGLAVNLRNPKFQDIRVRQALGYLLNREAMNEKFMYNQYFLLNSFYPDLHPNNVNPEREVTPYNPEKARKLLADAGWKVNQLGKLEKDGQVFEITFLSAAEDFRHLNLYIEDLKSVGIEAKIEKINRSTLTKRIDNFEFEIFWTAWGASRLRDPESSWHSSTAGQKASQNYTGVEDEEIDRLIELQKGSTIWISGSKFSKKLITGWLKSFPTSFYGSQIMEEFFIGTNIRLPNMSLINLDRKIQSLPLGAKAKKW